MKEFINKMTEKITETHEAMMENMENFFSIEKFTQAFSDVSDAAREKAANFSSELISMSPIIEEIGFKTKAITISMGIPPSATFHFNKFKDISPERRQEILDAHKDKKLLGPVVKTLITADDFQKKIALGNFKFDCIEIQIGLGPGINVQLIPKD